MWKIFRAFVWTLGLISFVSAQTNLIVIKNTMIVDGSGKSAFRGDVGIKGDKIVKIGNIKPRKDEAVIDAAAKSF